MCGADLGILLFESEKAIRKSIQEAREATSVSLPNLSDFSSDEEMGLRETLQH